MAIPLTEPTPPLAGMGGSIVDPASSMPITLGPSVVPQSQQLTRNPMLPQHPLGAYTDAQYEAAVAQLRADTMNKYNDVLRQLGYVDDNGNFVMGSAETSADQKKAQDDYQEQLAREKVTQDMQQNGTLFSGWRGKQEGEATMPMEQDKAQIGIDLPNQLSQLYEQANGVLSDFVTQHNLLLADAASRAAQNFINNPPGPGVSMSGTNDTFAGFGGGGGGGGDSTSSSTPTPTPGLGAGGYVAPNPINVQPIRPGATLGPGETSGIHVPQPTVVPQPAFNPQAVSEAATSQIHKPGVQL
jgi:hypothetical protein